MAVIDSRQAGVLKQLGKEGGDAPENVIRKWMADITGLPLHRVVRRWLPRPGTRPGIDEDWIAVGVERVQTHGTPYQRGRKGQPEDAESGDVVRETHQTLHCIASFYGPNAAQAVGAAVRELGRAFRSRATATIRSPHWASSGCPASTSLSSSAARSPAPMACATS